MVSRFCFVCEISTPCDRESGSGQTDRVYAESLLGGGYMFSWSRVLKSTYSPFSILFLIVLGTGGRSRLPLLLGPARLGSGGGSADLFGEGLWFPVGEDSLLWLCDDGGEMFAGSCCCWIALRIPCCTNRVTVA